MSQPYRELAERALAGESLKEDVAHWILEGEDVELLPLLQCAFEPRRKHFGRRVMVQVLNNIQNGLCPEDCGYCPQAKGSNAAIRKYPMKAESEIFAEAEAATASGASRYCMAASGRGPGLEGTRRLASIVEKLKATYPLEICLSIGLVDDEKAAILAEAGLDRLNHNLNTSESHYESICSTHSWADRIETLAVAQRNHLETCSGMIIGMGEASRDIVEVAFKLRELEVPSIPVNFLIPIEGNRVLEDGSLTPERCLRVLCLMRLVSPAAELRMAGGREGNLRSLQPLALYPANSLFVEGYLTTRGDAARETAQMIVDAGFEIEGNELSAGPAVSPRTGFRLPGNDALLKPEIAR